MPSSTRAALAVSSSPWSPAGLTVDGDRSFLPLLLEHLLGAGVELPGARQILSAITDDDATGDVGGQREARNAAVWPMSSTLPARRIGTASMSAAFAAGLDSRFMPSVPSMGPGTMLLARMPWRPHSSAKFFIIMSMPALAAPTCA